MHQEKNGNKYRLHNNYTFLLIDKDTEEIVQKAQAYNIAQVDFQNYNSNARYLDTSITLGTDSMTVSSPTTSDNRPVYYVRNYWRSAGISWSCVVEAHPKYSQFIKVTSSIQEWVGYATFSTSTGSADLTKVAITSGASYFYTTSFADIQDIEGNPIVIHKTGTQELVIQITYYIELFLPEYVSTENITAWTPKAQNPMYFYSQLDKNNSPNHLFGTDYLRYIRNSNSQYFIGLSTLTPPMKDSYQLECPLAIRSADGLFTANNSLRCPRNSQDQTYQGVDPETSSVNNSKIDVNVAMYNYIKTLYLREVGLVIDIVKNKNLICGEQKYLKFPYGTGDGQKIHFWKNLDEIVINKSTVTLGQQEIQLHEYNSSLEEQENEVTFLNFDVTKSPLWNKCTSIEFCNIIESNTQKDNFNRNDIITALPATNTTDYVDKRGIFRIDSASGPSEVNRLEGIYIPNTNLTYTNSPNEFFVVGDTTGMSLQTQMWNNPNGYTHSILNANLFNSDLEKLPSIVCPVYSLDEEKTIDHCILRNIYDELDANHIFYIDIHCKDSIEDPWQLVASEKLINTRNYTQEISFSPKAAKYWSFCFRLSSHPYSSLYGRNNREIPHLYQYDYPSNLTYNKISLDKAIIFGNSKEYDFRKVGLNFKTPPQESTEILLNATLDIPYKDDQIIMYETCETRVFGPKNNVAN